MIVDSGRARGERSQHAVLNGPCGKSGRGIGEVLQIMQILGLQVNCFVLDDTQM